MQGQGRDGEAKHFGQGSVTEGDRSWLFVGENGMGSTSVGVDKK